MMTWKSDEDNPGLHTVTFLAYGNNKENEFMWDTAEAAAETFVNFACKIQWGYIETTSPPSYMKDLNKIACDIKYDVQAFTFI